MDVDRVRKVKGIGGGGERLEYGPRRDLAAPIESSTPVTLRCPVFQASMPPGFTILIAYAPVERSSHAA